MTRLEKKVDGLELKLEGVEAKLEDKIDRLEVKVDNGLDKVRGESREDFRMLLGVQLGMFMTMILGFAGILLQHV